MKNTKKLQVSFLTACIVLGSVAANAFDLNYPPTEKSSEIDEYFSIPIADPYRWLENTDDPKTIAWTQEQNQFTQSFLSQIPFREKIKQRLTELMNYEKYSSPFKVGDYLFFGKNDGLQNQSVLYYQKGSEEATVFLDPNTFSAAGTTAISSMVTSHDHKYIAFSISVAGSDWETIRIMDIPTKTFLPDVLERSKFSSVSWQGNGFYYRRYIEENEAGSSQTTDRQKIYYHKLGDPQELDCLVFEDNDHPLWFYNTSTLEDERYAFLYASKGAGDASNAVWYKDLTNCQNSFAPLFTDFEFSYEILDMLRDHLLILTNANAPNQRLVLVDINHPSEADWKELIPEKPELLQWAQVAGGKLFVCYLKDAANQLCQYDLQGNFERIVPTPAFSTINGFEGSKDEDALFYSTASYTSPSVIYRHSVSTGQSEVWKQSRLTFNPEEYITRQIFYPSKDGTKIPMFIVHKKGLAYDGGAPTLLYGYGGFGVCMPPRFNPSQMLFLERNGILAFPILRGGGEYGRHWHEDGMLLKKQNVFDDFIAAAEYLVLTGYTSSTKLAINGASNGGLLVGACMTQRPDLFRVAIPAVGVLDMLRFHKFTVGYFWTTEYGSSDDPLEFQNLLQYSPLHNIKEGVKYPATLILTADHDDRVVPAHSFKFAATLQEKGSHANPVLIRIEHDAGHGSGKPLSKLIQEQTDYWSFILYHLNEKDGSQ